jgi:hypothetical protein
MVRMANFSETLDALSAKFDDLLGRMQSPEARKGMEAAFHASPEALGKAAAEAQAGVVLRLQK